MVSQQLFDGEGVGVEVGPSEVLEKGDDAEPDADVVLLLAVPADVVCDEVLVPVSEVAVSILLLVKGVQSGGFCGQG